ncbi:uncharacterized protein Z520_12328 [Fonsecaea multimorphosa CBS 102226]|uniref:Uncharacterized protein n=1 Tax=Fonsecaea multimorphosa CBS 102226 TaxID=1442371 RepID=A0A0D2JN95_9EURO|nr:uncharacterized protein Z520_12328 [Fonsecaea multimorphosa CBS 102226]KIX91939.1 hypothetical protein Z520_12328 [Fonsecaea multimorphosa CBS 102226]OAL17310.1 hypothetical protein AYO22_11752 [Fonsecaea multimorphosa]
MEPRKRGRPRMDARLDNWSEVRDKRERRIQDRLAQHVRRTCLLSQNARAVSRTSEILDSFDSNEHHVLTVSRRAAPPVREFLDLLSSPGDTLETSSEDSCAELRRATWDPHSWRLEPSFSRKWGYLFN